MSCPAANLLNSARLFAPAGVAATHSSAGNSRGNGRAIPLKGIGIATAACLIAACASTDNFVATPRVSLRDVQVTSLDVNRQTFLLSFDVTNPNPFPLPIRTVSYRLELDGHRLASGETEGDFTVPAGSDGGFAISVDVDLLQTAPQLLFVVRQGADREIPYALKGRFQVDVPFAAPLSFSNAGTVRPYAALFP